MATCNFLFIPGEWRCVLSTIPLISAFFTFLWFTHPSPLPLSLSPSYGPKRSHQNNPCKTLLYQHHLRKLYYTLLNFRLGVLAQVRGGRTITCVCFWRGGDDSHGNTMAGRGTCLSTVFSLSETPPLSLSRPLSAPSPLIPPAGSVSPLGIFIILSHPCK